MLHKWLLLLIPLEAGLRASVKRDCHGRIKGPMSWLMPAGRPSFGAEHAKDHEVTTDVVSHQGL